MLTSNKLKFSAGLRNNPMAQGPPESWCSSSGRGVWSISIPATGSHPTVQGSDVPYSTNSPFHRELTARFMGFCEGWSSWGSFMPFLRHRSWHFTPSRVPWPWGAMTAPWEHKSDSLAQSHALGPAGVSQERAETQVTSFKPPGPGESLPCGSGHIQDVATRPFQWPHSSLQTQTTVHPKLCHTARFFSPLLLMSVPGAIPEITWANSWLAIFGSSSHQGKREITLWAIQASWHTGHKHAF